MSGMDRRGLVLNAAVAEFGEHGWHGARIEAIATRAGISICVDDMHIPADKERYIEGANQQVAEVYSQ